MKLKKIYKNLRIRYLFTILLTVQTMFGGPRVFAQQVQPNADTFPVPTELQEELIFAAIGSLYEFTLNGQIYHAHYIGMFDHQTGQSCVQLSSTCLIYLQLKPELVGVATGSEKLFRITEPSNADYTEPKHFGGDATTDTGNFPDAGAVDPTVPSVGVGDVGVDVLKSARGAALQAGTMAAVINYFGAEQLDAAQAKLSRAIYELDGAVDEYRLATVTTSRQAIQLAKVIRGISAIAPSLSTENFKVADHGIDVQQLKIFTSKFDPKYQTRIETVSNKINSAPFQNTEKFYDLKKIGRDAVRISVESRSLGLVDISEAQLNIAETMADLLYGIDPITGVHRGIYELYTGKNIITGRSLSTLEQGLSGANAVLSLTTLGILLGVSRAFKAISMIAKGGVKVNYSAVMNNMRKIANGFVGAGVAGKAELKIADNLIKKEIAAGAVPTAEEAVVSVEKAVANGAIKRLAFKVDFIKIPTSDDAL